MRVASLVGTRPQFLKLSPLCDYINANKPFDHYVIHSGQHYDTSMSGNIFSELNIDSPIKTIERDKLCNDMNFGYMMKEIAETLIEYNIDVLIVFGDCDTTLAGAMAARKLDVRIVHVEAGMRSFNMSMPEEVNRVLTDRISDTLLCPHQDAISKLYDEGIRNDVHLVGNLQVELINNLMHKVIEDEPREYEFSLLTIHRDYNTTAKKISHYFDELSQVDMKFIFPTHPRTANIIADNNITVPSNIIMKEPFSYFDMLEHLYQCDFVITDSGGLQLESWYLGKKCVVMRSETEWVDAISSGTCKLYDYMTSLDQFIQSHNDTPVTDCYDLPVNTSELIIRHVVDYHD